ncbi:imine reductase family protein [Streptomyces marincola]|uniref:imine reductase family protein n=1 Tax=Streptomyces marincola TaxID=2878388 RepID=UPI001CF4DC7B|nr:NAD(P)-dependent oxidoreductase [Streptomyces marincola]UCM87747.1 NAD(P)-dependent oxidoreductase [Streptomyces marincola]
MNLNSGTPEEARAAAHWAAERGAAYLDGAIMVPPPLVGQPDAVFLYSGPRAVFDEHRDALATLGDPRYLGPDPGLAVLYNAALLDLMYATVNGLLHATALARSAEVPATEFVDLVRTWFMPTVIDAAFAEQAVNLGPGHYSGDVGTMEMNRTALDHITRTCLEQGVDAAAPRFMTELAERAIAAGHGEDNYLALFEVFRKAAPDA